MEQYLTYEEYTELGGTMSESEFPVAEYKAQSRIDYLTDSRVQNMAEIPDAVKLAIMAIMKVDAVYDSGAVASNPIVASFSTDGYSESYGGISEQAQVADKELNSSISRLLYGVKDDNGVPLLYRGL